MNRLLALALTILLTALLSPALAERGDGRHERVDRSDRGYNLPGERIEQHFDRKGDLIEQRFDRKADRAEAQGRHAMAQHLRAQGDRIDRRFDRKGEQLHARFDRRHEHRSDHRSDQRYDHRRDHRCDPRHDHRDDRRHLERWSYWPAHTDRPTSHFNRTISLPQLVFGWDWYN